MERSQARSDGAEDEHNDRSGTLSTLNLLVSTLDSRKEVTSAR